MRLHGGRPLERPRLAPRLRDPAKLLGGLLGFFAALVPAVAGWFAPKLAYTGLTRGEIVYRLFIAFYGLIFPAYVWICVIPAGGKSGPPDRRRFRVFALAVIAAAPMFWMGFIERQTVWFAPGVGLVFLARWLVVARGPR